MAKLNTLREFIETQLKQRDMSARQFSELVRVLAVSGIKNAPGLSTGAFPLASPHQIVHVPRYWERRTSGEMWTGTVSRQLHQVSVQRAM